MGDLLMSLPAVRQVRVAFPDAEIALLMRDELRALLEGHPDVDQIIPWDAREGQGWRPMLRWGKVLRRERFDAAVVINPTKFFHAAVWLAGIPVRVGYRRKWGFLLTDSIPDTKHARDGHEADYNLELLPLLGVRPSGPVLKLPVAARAEAEALSLIQEAGLQADPRPVAVHPWTSNSSKSWPLDSFAQLVRLLAGSKMPVLVIGGEENRHGMREWAKGLPEGTADLVGRVPLRLLPAVIKRCRALVSNDSGPVHVASAVGTPTVVVAPRSHAKVLERWKPLGAPHKVMIAPEPSQVAQMVRERALP